MKICQSSETARTILNERNFSQLSQLAPKKTSAGQCGSRVPRLGKTTVTGVSRHHWWPIEDPLEPSRTSQHYGIEHYGPSIIRRPLCRKTPGLSRTHSRNVSVFPFWSEKKVYGKKSSFAFALLFLVLSFRAIRYYAWRVLCKVLLAIPTENLKKNQPHRGHV